MQISSQYNGPQSKRQSHVQTTPDVQVLTHRKDLQPTPPSKLNLEHGRQAWNNNIQKEATSEIMWKQEKETYRNSSPFQ